MSTTPHLFLLLLTITITTTFTPSLSQQPYTNNDMLDCYTKNSSGTLGYSCNGNKPNCSSFLTFRTTTTYSTPTSIARFLSASAPAITQLNNLSSNSTPIPVNTLLLIPITCSCTTAPSGYLYYQHSSYYVLQSKSQTYQILANDTYEGLSTCQALMAQNPSHDSRHLDPRINLTVPLRCACPTKAQQAKGYRYLLSYLITWGDEVSTIAQTFRSHEDDVWDANTLEKGATIFPFTTLLVPLKTQPSAEWLRGYGLPPMTAPAAQPPAPPPAGGSSGKKWVVVGVCIGAAVLAISTVSLAVLWRRRQRPSAASGAVYSGVVDAEKPAVYSSSSVVSEDVRLIVGSLAVYKFEELERATGFFGESNRIKGSVYRGMINGTPAAVKRMKGDVSNEINMLKHMNHGNLVRLSGFCVHDASTYLVFEFVEKGSLFDWIHGSKLGSLGLEWRLRVQIAYDIADAINYLHNYTTPQCIHKDLNSSNILLDGEFRAKVANFGLARSTDGGEGMQLTRHVVGTQGYMSPEYLQHGVVSPKVDIFAFGVVLLELLSGKEAVFVKEGERKEEALLSDTIGEVLSGEDARNKLKEFMDPSLGDSYSFESAYALAQLAKQCVAKEPLSRPKIADVFVVLLGIHSAASDWDPSSENTNSSTISAR